MDQGFTNLVEVNEKSLHSETEDRLANVSLDLPKAVQLLFLACLMLDQDVFEIEEVYFLHFLCFLIELGKSSVRRSSCLSLI